MLQLYGISMPDAAATTSASVNTCVISGAAAAAHGHLPSAGDCLVWRNVGQGGTCLRRIHIPSRPQVVERKRRTDFVPPGPSCAGVSAESSQFGSVVREQNDAGVSTSFSTMQSTLLHLRNAGIISCLRSSSADVALDAARAALDGGLTVVIESLVREYPSAIIGAGTVLSEAEADMAKQAGAKFLTSPVTVEEIVLTHRHGPVPFFPGAMTPSEVMSGYNMGASAMKLFPTALLGGINFVLTLRKALPHIPLIPSNGISLDMVESYFNAGVMAVIVSDGIFEKSALQCRDFSRIKTLASSAASKSLLSKIEYEIR